MLKVPGWLITACGALRSAYTVTDGATFVVVSVGPGRRADTIPLKRSVISVPADTCFYIEERIFYWCKTYSDTNMYVLFNWTLASITRRYLKW